MKGGVFTCTASSCSLRFPAELEDPRAQACPVCGAQTILSARIPDGQGGAWPRPAIAAGGPPIRLILDNLRSAYNVGSLFRSADGAGVEHIYLCGVCPTPEHRGVRKTSLGAEQALPWSHHKNGPALAQTLIQKGWALWALETGAKAASLYQRIPVKPTALVLGNERFGVDPAILAGCETVVHLPMLGQKRSLNAASAGAIALYHLRFAARSGDEATKTAY